MTKAAKAKKAENKRKAEWARADRERIRVKTKGGDESVRVRARVLFAEPPQKAYGNPFVAVRVPAAVRDAFVKHCKAKKTTATEMLRAYMARVGGVSLSEAEGED